MVESFVKVSFTENDMSTEIQADPMKVLMAIGILMEIFEKSTGMTQEMIAESVLLANKKFPQLEKATHVKGMK